MTKHQNKLIRASSPYLLQHAHNPVDWHEWNEEALEKAKKEDKPLIVSIGYAACHWCHVMEHESFEDEEVARLMNENFVCIKVDREERPDIDQIYMDACMLLNRNGGWPLNAFALPDGKPFYAATYFPKQNWISVLSQITDLYKNDFEKIKEQAEIITNGIKGNELVNTIQTTIDISKEEYKQIYNNWKPLIDWDYGGYDKAPKFPLPAGWEFLLQYNYLTNDKSALDAVQITLDKMALGGIYDQVGGGFARYSVDRIWLVPHFEKMLYDNAQLVSLYSNTYKVTKKELYKEIVYETIEFVERELSTAAGGFYSSLNADSEGKEGKFYVWSYNEFVNLFPEREGKLLARFFDITENGNWEGINIPNIKIPKEGFATWNKLNIEELKNLILDAKRKLLADREKRTKPSTDDKILTSWNALMLKGYLDAYTAFGEEKFLISAIKNADFLVEKMMQSSGKLFRNYKNNTATIDAFLDDYSLLASGFLKLYEVTFIENWLHQAKVLIDYAMDHFYDETNQLFFYTSDIGEKLVARKKEVSDNVIPASNSVMAHNLFKLGKIYDNKSYLNLAEEMLQKVHSSLLHGGPYYSNWALLAGLYIYGNYEIAIAGENEEKLNSEMQKHYLPDSIFIGSRSKSKLPLLENKLVEGKTLIYVCRNYTCQLPVASVEEGLRQINSKEKKADHE